MKMWLPLLALLCIASHADDWSKVMSYEELTEVQTMIDSLNAGLQLELGVVNEDSEVIVEWVRKLTDSGTYYIAALRVDDSSWPVIAFFVPDSREQEPRDLSIMSDGSTSSEEPPHDITTGDWSKVESAEELEEVQTMVDALNDKLQLQAIQVDAAVKQTVAGSNYIVTILINGTSELDIAFFVPLPSDSGEQEVYKEQGRNNDEDQVLSNGYYRFGPDKLLEAQLYVDVLNADIMGELDLSSECRVTVSDGQYKEDGGTFFLVGIDACGTDGNIAFYMPSVDEDPYSMPRDLEVIDVDPIEFAYAPSDGSEGVLDECPAGMVMWDDECVYRLDPGLTLGAKIVIGIIQG